MQFAYLEGIRDYILKKKDYLMTQIGNPDGEVSDVSCLSRPTLTPRYSMNQTRATMIQENGSVRAKSP